MIKIIAFVAFWFFPIGTALSIYLWFAHIRGKDTLDTGNQSLKNKKIEIKGGFNDRINEQLAAKIINDEKEEQAKKDLIREREKRIRKEVAQLDIHLDVLAIQIRQSYPWCEVRSGVGENMLGQYVFNFTIGGSFQHDIGISLREPFLIAVDESDIHENGYTCHVSYFNGVLEKYENNKESFKIEINSDDSSFDEIDQHIENFFFTLIPCLKTIGYKTQ